MPKDDAKKAVVAAAASNPLVAGVVLMLGLGAMVELRIAPAYDEANEAMVTSAARVEVAVEHHAKVLEEQGQTIEKILGEVSVIVARINTLGESLSNLRGYMQASLENLRNELRRYVDERVDERDETLRKELMERMERLIDRVE